MGEIKTFAFVEGAMGLGICHSLCDALSRVCVFPRSL